MPDTLTDAKIRQAKPAAKPGKIFDGRGLFLLITPSGGKWWRFKYLWWKSQKYFSGRLSGCRLREARERREAARKLLASGIDPSEERKAAKAEQTRAERRQRDTFQAVAQEWFEKFSPAWATSHADTVIRRLERDLFPWLRSRPVGEITAVELLEVLRRENPPYGILGGTMETQVGDLD